MGQAKSIGSRAARLQKGGKEAYVLRVKDGVRRDDPTCRLSGRLGDMQHRAQVARQEACVVVNQAGIVLGYVGGNAFDTAPEMLVKPVMEPGPAAIRPHVSLTEITEYMQRRDIDKILMTTADGELVGLLHHQDAEQTHG